MKDLFALKNIWILLVIILGGFYCHGVAIVHGAESNILIIANSGVSVDQISKADLKKIFLGKKATLGNIGKVVPAILKSGDTHKAFLKTYVGKSQNAYTGSWKKLVFTGKGTMPKSFSSEEELVAYTANTNGAIGYISAGVPHESVKTLAVK